MSTVADPGWHLFVSQSANRRIHVVVDAGSEYEKAREPVNIDREEAGGSTIAGSSPFNCHRKWTSSNPLFANVPDKALKLYQKGSAAAKKGDAKAAVESLSAP
jgi:hypothetical protein